MSQRELRKEDGQAYYRVRIKSYSNELCDKHGRKRYDRARHCANFGKARL